MNQGEILVTGGTGYLGSHLVRRLSELGYEVIVLIRNESHTYRIEKLPRVLFFNIEKEDLNDLFESKKINIIIHCATNYGRSVIDPLQIIHANLILPVNLLELAKKYNVRTFINTDTILDKGVSSYALSKKQFLDWFKLAAKDMCCINMALEHFYGPHDDSSKFVSKVIRSLQSHIPILELTPGEQKRDFIYIDDVIDAFICIIQSHIILQKGFFHFDVGSGQLISIKDFVHLISSLTNSKTKLAFGAIPYRENEVMESKVDIARLCELGWLANTNLKQGLYKTIQLEKELVEK